MKNIKIITSLFIFSVAFLSTNQAFAENIPKDFFTIQPAYEYESWQDTGDDKISLPPDAANQADIIVAPVRSILNKFPNFTYSLALKDGEITPEVIKSIGRNQIVSWQGHGNWDDANSLINLQLVVPFEDYNSNPDYAEDISDKSIVNADGYYAGITPRYINKYGGDMTGTLIYIGACESGHEGNDALARAFLDKGASAVVVMSKTINALYGNIMQYTTIKLLGEINPETEDYYTLGEALEKAKSIYGPTDKWLYPANLGAEALIFGDANYRIARTEKSNVPAVPNTGKFTEPENNFTSDFMAPLIIILSLISSCCLSINLAKR